MDSDEVGDKGGVSCVTVLRTALNCTTVPDTNVLDMGSESRSSQSSGKKANKRGKRSGHKGGENKKKMLATINKRVLGHPDGNS